MQLRIMEQTIFNSKKSWFSNLILVGALVITGIIYLFLLVLEPELWWIIILLIIDVPLIGYFLLAIIQ